MNFYLLDVVDAPVVHSGYRIFIAIVALTILVEALVMLLMKYNLFKKALLDSFLVNIASLVIGFVLAELVNDIFNSYKLPDLLLLCAITIGVESGILYGLNRKHRVLKTLGTCVVMNLASYFLFYLFTLSR